MTTALASLFATLAFAAGHGTILAVPFLPQTPALCGGASAAMVFRYWGDRRADVQQFARYVDARAGGIADDVLIDAIQERQWKVERLTGSIDAIRERIAAREPVILLLDDPAGSSRLFHYVVAVGADERHIYVHDPTWGPSRRHTNEQLIERWKPSGFWSLVVRPGIFPDTSGRFDPHGVGPHGVDPHGVGPSFSSGRYAPDLKVGPTSATTPAPFPAACDRLLEEAVDEIGRRGLSSADELLRNVSSRCPRSAGPLAELAGLRLVEQRLAEAESLARDALEKDPAYAFAWDVLGSVRFMHDDGVGALQAWNRIGKPRLDSVQIDGLTHTRYALVAEAIGLPPNHVLTESAYRLADRRLGMLPTGLITTMRYRPEEDGYATLKVAIVERGVAPQGLPQWIGAATRSIANREVRTTMPGWSGQGEAWSLSWRWWRHRPRVAMAFEAPRAFGLPGVARVEVSWEEQSYRLANDVPTAETQVHGGITVADWLTADLRYEIGAGVDEWNRSRRTIFAGVEVEQRLVRDHVSLTGRARSWAPASAGSVFRSGSFGAAFRSSEDRAGFVHTIDLGIDAASRDAPLALWSGAGDGYARSALLRAHPLLESGVVTAPVFGRRMVHLTAESTRWLEAFSPARIGVAAFIDAARASHGSSGAAARALADIGTGVRVALPGAEGVLRADYAHGVRDGRDAFSVGWLITTRR